MQIRYVDGRRLRRALLAACEHAQLQRGELNRINVFPVPDGDTGTNLSLTLQAVRDRLRPLDRREISAVASEAAEGAVVGARGNCGMMLSHFLLGFAEGLASKSRVGTREFSQALSLGARRLSDAIEHPVEGTILTVMRDVASAAGRSRAADFTALLDHLVEGAQRSLAQTPELLPVLKRAGVVDAGAKGFVSLLEGVQLLVHEDRTAGETSQVVEPAVGPSLIEVYATEVGQFRFCTEALVRGDRLPAQGVAYDALRDSGDSLIVIRAGNVLKVHVHTNEPELVFAYLRSVGTLVTHKAEDMNAQSDAVRGSAQGHVLLARRPVAIVTDSACDLSEEVLRAHGIHVTPLALVEGGRTYRDGVDVSAADFHERLRLKGPLPTTSQPAPADFLETYGRALEEAESVVAVLAGSTLSGTFASASAAASRMASERIQVVDSLGASLLEGLLALKAAELGELARDPDEIKAELTRVRGQSGMLFAAGDLDRLIASGRVTRAQALVGRALSVRPIFELRVDGTVVVSGKALGRRRARAILLAKLRERIPPGAGRVRFGVVHVGVPAVAEEVVAALRSEYGSKTEVLTAPATPVIATHTGIGTWGVAYLVED